MRVSGSPVLAGVTALHEELAPLVGARRCRISKPLNAPATHSGRFGRGWLVDLPTARKKLPPGTPPDAMVVHWVIEAPWTSEVVHSYSLICVHLRFGFNYKPVVRHFKDATHEVALWAIDPQADREAMLAAPIDPSSWLMPTVFASQIVLRNDADALVLLGRTVELICAGRLSPHPTHMRSWAEIFGDNMLVRAVAPSESGGSKA